MAKNKKSIKPRREMSRQQLSNWQRQEKRQRLVLNIAIGVVAAVFLIIGLGWFFTNYQPRHQKVLVMNGTTFRMNQYISALKYYSGDDPTKVSQLSPSIISSIEEMEFVREGARQLGLSVADNETEAALKTSGLKGEYRDFVSVGLLAQKVYDHFKSQLPTHAEYRHIKALFVESDSKAQTTRDAINAGSDFGDVASLSSLDSYSKQQKSDLGFQMKEILAQPSYLGTNAVGNFAFSAPADNTTINIVKDDAKVKNLGYWLIKVTDKQNTTADNTTTSDNTTPARVRISAILLGSSDEAEKVKSRLDSGEDFVAVAKEVSQDKTSRDQGGDLGWFSKGTIRPAFETFAVDPAVTLNKLSDVISDNATVTTGGYWLVLVVEADPNREVASGDLDLLANAAYTDWYNAIKTNPQNKIDIILTEAQRTWAVQTATKELGG